MCIIIDTNTLPNVFNKWAANHDEFKPVLDWVLDSRGKFVYGGTKYLKEIGKYVTIFNELRKVRKAVKRDLEKVDAKELWAAAQIQHADFDDQHLVGLLLESGCKLICSLDERAYPFFRHATFFSPASKRPKIYTQKGNVDLLTDRNITEICKPLEKLTVAKKQAFNILQ